MLRFALLASLLVAAALLWAAGLRLFLAAGMTTRRKLLWSAFLVAAGIAIGFVLPLREVAIKFLWVLAILPILAAIDVFLLRSSRGLAYWIRACGFEVVTVFAVAAGARWILDRVGVGPIVERAVA